MDVELIASELVSLWREIDAVLCPIIGRRGVTALFQRSLYLTAKTYSWLAIPNDGAQASIDFTGLSALLINQKPTELILCGALLFKAFYELLVSLVGPSLTERLLRSVEIQFLAVHPRQDCS